jgi:hypothetical protein
VSVLHGGYDAWLAKGFSTEPKGSEWKAAEAPAVPLDATREAGL